MHFWPSKSHGWVCRWTPYSVTKCVICKQQLHQDVEYCQSYAHKKGMSVLLKSQTVHSALRRKHCYHMWVLPEYVCFWCIILYTPTVDRNSGPQLEALKSGTQFCTWANYLCLASMEPVFFGKLSAAPASLSSRFMSCDKHLELHLKKKELMVGWAESALGMGSHSRSPSGEPGYVDIKSSFIWLFLFCSKCNIHPLEIHFI